MMVVMGMQFALLIPGLSGLPVLELAVIIGFSWAHGGGGWEGRVGLVVVGL